MNIERHYLENDVNISYARQKVVLDAKAAGIQCMDAGLLNRDEEINNAYSEHARRLGFDAAPLSPNAKQNTPTKFSSLQRQLLIG